MFDWHGFGRILPECKPIPSARCTTFRQKTGTMKSLHCRIDGTVSEFLGPLVLNFVDGNGLASFLLVLCTSQS